MLCFVQLWCVGLRYVQVVIGTPLCYVLVGCGWFS